MRSRFLLLVLLVARASLADEARLTDDSFVNSGAPAQNQGGNDNLNVIGPGNGATRRAFLRFDLSSLPAGTTANDVASATLTLFLNKVATAGSIDVQRVPSAWSEATITNNNAPAAGPVVGTLAAAAANSFAAVDLTALVKSWVAGGVPNQGIALVANPNTPAVNVAFDSKENGGTSHWARLSISLTPSKLADRIAALESGAAALQSTVAAQQAQIGQLQAALASLPFTVSGNEVVFSGFNLRIVNGTGSTTSTINGLGNLIIGYDEMRGDGTDDRSGSHNLVLGTRNNYSKAAGIVAGSHNTISNYFATVTGGFNNTASGNSSSVSGGQSNVASGNNAAVGGGVVNTASGDWSSISGGSSNSASGETASVSGGEVNLASGTGTWVGGGAHNSATGSVSAVSGGNGKSAASGISVSADTALTQGLADEVFARSELSFLLQSFSRSGVDVYFTGNLHVVSGSGATDGLPNGMGNLIIGYNEPRGDGTDNRAGSHNLVLGMSENYPSYAAVVAGYRNEAGPHSFVHGYANTASGHWATVAGGDGNTASGLLSTILGGVQVQAADNFETVSGDPALANVSGLLQNFSRTGNDIFLTGANLHIVDGSGRTEAASGLGNLIIGYNELRGDGTDARNGSHNLVLGQLNNYQSYGSILSGLDNEASAPHTVVHGHQNIASGPFSAIAGGELNVASELYSIISGGSRNASSGLNSVVSGGLDNSASGLNAVVSGGRLNSATGETASVAGGVSNTASGLFTAVSGDTANANLAALLQNFSRSGNDVVITGANLRLVNGMGSTGSANGTGNLIVGYNESRGAGDDRSGSHNVVVGNQNNYGSWGGLVVGSANTISGAYASVCGGSVNTASGSFSSVSGGESNQASGEGASISGGKLNTANALVSSVSGGENNFSQARGASIAGGVFGAAAGTDSAVGGGNGVAVGLNSGWAAGTLHSP